MARLIDLQPSTPHKCPACNGIGSIPSEDEAMRVFLGETAKSAPWVLCPKCEGIGRVFANGKPARIGNGEATEPPPL